MKSNKLLSVSSARVSLDSLPNAFAPWFRREYVFGGCVAQTFLSAGSRCFPAPCGQDVPGTRKSQEPADKNVCATLNTYRRDESRSQDGGALHFQHVTRRSPAVAGFTLIELLVVVAIIAILAS